ncbi:MAG: hypothetical protein IE927_15000 [Rhodobacterales bacterium]|nr:hypothetical protein [Rhodobacterales bacterium]
MFLARRPYRRRRRVDAARLLPVFGTVLFLMPMMWRPAGGRANALAADGVWLFLVWAGLIAVARLLAPSLSPEGEADPAEDRG